MERSEPALVPEWLRSAGSVTGGGSSTHHSTSSSSHSDVSSSVHPARNWSSRSRSDAISSRSYSSNSRRGSSNGSAKHAYSSFTRHRDKDRDRDKDSLSFLDPWDRDASDPLGRTFTGRDKDGFRRSYSMVSREQGEVLPHRDLKNGGSNGNNRNGILSGPGKFLGTGGHKVVFEKDFPSLGSEDREGLTDVSRVSSPCLTPVVRSLPAVSSAVIGGEGWTSALAEVPSVIVSGNMGSFSSSQTGGPTHTGTGTPSSTPGLNMAEALTQAPSRVHTPPQLSLKTQRLEELAFKQSRQLIPVTPSMPKGSVLSSSDKSKAKAVARPGEMSLNTSRSGLQQPSTFPHPVQSLPDGQSKPDSSKNSLGGKLFVLRPSRENGVTPFPKDVVCPTNNANSRASSSNHLAVPASVAAPPTKTSNSSRDRMPGLTLEKRPSLSRTKSRNDFFKLLKQQSATNMSTDSSAGEKPGLPKETASAAESPHATVTYTEVTNNGDASERLQRFSQVEEKNLSLDAAGYPNEEELAFLRELGWEEPHGEDEGLTKEEIEAFIKQFNKSKPSLKVCRGFIPELSEIQETSLDGASYELSS